MSTRPARLKLESVSRRSDTDAHRVEVTLSFNGKALVGRTPAEPGGAGPEPLREAALATIDAVESAVDRRISCELRDVEVASILDQKFIALLLDVTFEGRRNQIYGICQADHDLEVAAVRATLDATNRFVELAGVAAARGE